MQKLNFIYASISFSHFQRNKRSVKRLTKQGSKAVVAKAAAILSLVAASYLPAAAQCKTLINADAANPILSVLPAGTYVYAVNFMDIDADGDLDCYVSTNEDYTPLLYLNKGNEHHPVYERSIESGFDENEYIYSEEYIQFVDIDGDGDYDCFASDVYSGYYSAHIHFYQNTGTPQKPDFVKNDAINPVGGIRVNGSIPFQFADMDSDGDPDLYYYARGTFWNDPSYDAIIRNTGTKTNPVFTQTESYKLNTDRRKDRVYYDWNNDGLLDYFASAEAGSTLSFLNVGTKDDPKYVDATSNGPIFKNGGPYQIVDLNGDGSPEVFTFEGHYSTIAPVAVIGDTTVTQKGVATRVLYSINRSSAYQYQWELNGKKIPGADGYFIKVTCAGTYTLYIKNACGVGVSLNYIVTDNMLVAQEKTASSIHPSVSSAAVKAYPNPFVNEFVVQLPPATGTTSTVQITDFAGRILLSQTTAAGTIKLGNALQKGMYLLQVVQNNKVVYTTKIAKQ